jgi:ubiquilin
MVELSLNIRCCTGKSFQVSTSDSLTVLEFKQMLSSPELSDVPVEQQRLIYKGRVLKDELTLESYGKDLTPAWHLICACNFEFNINRSVDCNY